MIIELRERDYKKYINRFQQLLLAITLLSIVVAIVVICFGKVVIFILYGSEYIEAVIPLGILVCATGFAMIGTARGIWIVAEGYNRYSKYYILIGAGVNFILNIFAIQYWGIIGASITTLISQIIVAFVSPLFFEKTRQFDKIYFGCFRQFPVLCDMARNYLKI